MTTPFRLPDLGEGVHEAEILAIPVTAGQEVKEGDIILEIETDKAAVEIPSPCTGTVAEILVHPGERAEVGKVLITFRTEKDAAPAEPPGPPPSPPVQPQPPGEKSRGPVPASPSTRRLAREMGVLLHEVTPSGSGGVVTKDDVLAHARAREAGRQPAPPEAAVTPAVAEPEAEAAAAPSPTPAAPAVSPGRLPDFARWGPVERLPFRSIRRATATQMTTSWSQIPHVFCQDDVDITRLEAFRQRHKADIAKAGGRLTMTVFALKAAATALKLHPAFNASLDLAAQEIVVKHYFHIGVAVDSEHGLTVPVIRDVDRKSIKELAIELEELVTRVRGGKLRREEMQGGTFTITNAGAMGGHHFSAIINYPEVAILGLGQGRMQPAVVTDDRGRQEIMPRLIMPIVLSFDHRVMDGADTLRFLKVVIKALEDPDELLITMV